MKTSERGLQFIREQEGFSSRLYNDEADDCTVGYGHLVHLGRCDGRPAEAPYSKFITLQEAEELLAKDVAEKSERAIAEYVRVDLTQSQYDALASLIFNIGVAAFSASHLLRHLNDGQYAAAADQFHRWDMAGGHVSAVLQRRRALEAAIFTEQAEAAGV